MRGLDVNVNGIAGVMITHKVLQSFKGQVYVIKGTRKKTVCKLYVFDLSSQRWEKVDNKTFGDVYLPRRTYGYFPYYSSKTYEKIRKMWRDFVKTQHFMDAFPETDKLIEVLNKTRQ